MKILKWSVIAVIILLSLVGFFYINDSNYSEKKHIRETIVRHPDMLPQPEFAKVTSFGFKNIKADLFRLETIQYIGGNAISAKYKKYLFKIIDLITELNPYFEWPYIIWEILMPSYNFRYENLSDKVQKDYIEQSKLVWLKWIRNFCDMEKVEKIKKENDLSKLWKDEQYRNPCKSKKVPFYLAFIYYFYLNDPVEASNYYKVTSAIDDTYEGAKIMAAIMQWKAWNRLTSTFMFLNLAKTTDQTDQMCQKFSAELENVSFGVFKNQIPLDGKLIKSIQKTRAVALWGYDEEAERSGFWDTKCLNYANKAVRELNLLYLENANTLYKKDHQGKSVSSPEDLFNAHYIDFIPTDFQQYKAGYGIIYDYNPEIQKFDYTMSEIKGWK